MMSVDLLSISWNSSDQKQLVQIPHQLFYPVIDIAMVMKSLIYSLCFYAIFANTVKSIESQSINNKYDESSRRIHMEKMKIFPWVNRINKVNPDVSHEVIVAIEPLNMDYLENSVIERSTPGNKLFQKWMTFDQVGQLTTNREGFNVVQNWLLNENVTITWVHEYSHYIKASASISTWERLLHAEFHEWEREREVNSMETTTTKKPKSVVIRSDSYSVPDFIAPYVSAIFNTVQMPPRISKHYSIKDVPDVDQPYKTDMIFHDKNLRTPKNSKTIDLEDTTIANLVSVTFLDNYYQIPTNIGDPTLQQIVFATAQSTQGSNIGNYYSQSDLNISLGNLGVPDKYKVAHNHNHSKYNIPGSSCSTGMASGGSLDCNEGNLDVQYIMGLAQQVSTVYWYVDSSHIADPFLELLTELFSSKVKSTVVSISYGSIEQVNINQN